MGQQRSMEKICIRETLMQLVEDTARNRRIIDVLGNLPIEYISTRNRTAHDQNQEISIQLCRKLTVCHAYLIAAQIGKEVTYNHALAVMWW